MDDYNRRVLYLLSMGHPVSVRDVATLTFSCENDVLTAIEQLKEMGFDVWSDGESAEIRGQIDGA